MNSYGTFGFLAAVPDLLKDASLLALINTFNCIVVDGLLLSTFVDRGILATAYLFVNVVVIHIFFAFL